MEDVEVCWLILAGVVGAAWSLGTCIRTLRTQGVELTNKVINCLLEGDQLVIEHPEVQMYLSRNARQDAAFFHPDPVPGEPEFYQAKSFVYRQLNIFDFLLSISPAKVKKISFFNVSPVAEISDWHSYIQCKLRHPLYQWILDNEGEIFGAALRDFWKKHKTEILSRPIDPLLW